MNLRDIQAAAWANKLAKGFNITDVPLEFCLMNEEVGEAFSAWRKGYSRDYAGELADIAIFLVSIAEMTGVDLQAAVEKKLTQNAARKYRLLPNGTPVKDDAPC